MSQDTLGQEELSSQEQVPTQEQVEETPESQPDSNTNSQDNPDELPEEVKERTRRNFERMRKERDDARKEAEALRLSRQQAPFQIPETPNLTQAQVKQIENNFVDEDGNVDVLGLQKALQQSNQQSALATQQAQEAIIQAQKSQEEIRRYEQTRQAQEAYTHYPQLDPDNPDYDETFYLAVRNHLIGDYSEGKNTTLIQAASQIAKYYKPVEEVKKQAVSEYKQSQEKRSQGPIESGRGESRSQRDEDSLRRGTMMNETEAIMERLKRVK